MVAVDLKFSQFSVKLLQKHHRKTFYTRGRCFSFFSPCMWFLREINLLSQCNNLISFPPSSEIWDCGCNTTKNFSLRYYISRKHSLLFLQLSTQYNDSGRFNDQFVYNCVVDEPFLSGPCVLVPSKLMVLYEMYIYCRASTSNLHSAALIGGWGWAKERDNELMKRLHNICY